MLIWNNFRTYPFPTSRSRLPMPYCVGNSVWTICWKKLWTICWTKLWTKIMEKLWKALHRLWTNCSQIVNKLFTDCEQIVHRLWGEIGKKTSQCLNGIEQIDVTRPKFLSVCKNKFNSQGAPFWIDKLILATRWRHLIKKNSECCKILKPTNFLSLHFNGQGVGAPLNQTLSGLLPCFIFPDCKEVGGQPDRKFYVFLTQQTTKYTPLPMYVLVDLLLFG